jgi:nitroreductase
MLQKMAFGVPVTDLVRRRYSCRSFAGRALEPGTLSKLEAFPAGLELPFRSRLRFGVIDGKAVRAQSLFSTGSYGLIKGARFYLAALAGRSDPRRWEDIGFALEAAVLLAAALGVGSCWIGGVFDRRNFGRALGILPGEQLPAVVAVGWPAARPSLRERVVRWGARGKTRKEAGDLFFSQDWRSPLAIGGLGHWAQVLECVRLGPSASNKQPWRIVRRDEAFHFFLDRDKAYSSLMPLADLQRIDLGIAMCHFQLAAVELGLQGEWSPHEPHVPGTPANYEYIASFLPAEK